MSLPYPIIKTGPNTAQTLLKDSHHWELLRERWAGRIHRSVHRVDGELIVKKFEIPLNFRRYRQPWLREHAALRRLDGCNAPRSFGWFMEEESDHRIVWLVKEYLPGTPLEIFTAIDLPDLATLLARLHSRRVITDDAYPGNFLRNLDGRLMYLDLGRAQTASRLNPFFPFQIGWELAKLYRQGFRRNPKLWNAFLPLYFQALSPTFFEWAGIRAACSSAVGIRFIRKWFQGKDPRS